jgi:hypothetical protein
VEKFTPSLTETKFAEAETVVPDATFIERLEKKPGGVGLTVTPGDCVTNQVALVAALVLMNKFQPTGTISEVPDGMFSI